MTGDTIKSKTLEQSFWLWKGRLLRENIAHGSVPMTNYSPRCDRPNFVIAGHPRTKLPCAKLVLYLSKTSYDLVHCGALRGILLNHVVDEWLDEI
jgi:hypothetical protein